MKYPVDTEWTFRSLKANYEQTIPLVLYWEAELSAMSDDYTPDEADAEELFASWLKELKRKNAYSKEFGEGWVEISWSVTAPTGGIHEWAPFQQLTWLRDSESFLSFFSWPTSAETDERLNWLRLPVVDKAWREGLADKGGFVQEATGWKPSALQPVMHVETLREASGA
jgi:hypothetical protein